MLNEKSKTIDERQSIMEFLCELENKKIKVWTEDGKLRYKAPVDAINDELLSELKDKKSKIIECLKAQNEEKLLFEFISKVEKRDYYPLSSAQKRMLLVHNFNKYSTAYNLTHAVKIEGEFDKNRLVDVIQKLTDRHDSLRTYFSFIDGEHVQCICDQLKFELEYEDVDEAQIDQVIKEFVRPFDLSCAPLFRYKLVKIKNPGSQPVHYLIQDMHHIISDGISAGILVKEVNELYAGKSLAPLSIQYTDYVVWQERILNGMEGERQKQYWLKELEGSIPILNLPTDKQRPKAFSFEGDLVHFEISRELTEKMQQRAIENHVTLYTFLLSLYSILLSKYSGQYDIAIGAPTGGRRHAELYNLIGMFVNTLVVRTFPSPEKSFNTFLKELGSKVLDDFSNQDYPFDWLVEELKVKRDLSRNPVFDAAFVLQNIKIDEVKGAGLTISGYPVKSQNAIFDITFTAYEHENGITMEINYCTSLFKRETIERMVGHYLNMLNQVLENPDKLLGDITILIDEEKQKLLYEYNETKAGYPEDMSIHGIFEEQARKTPGNKAVVFEDKVLTYSELNHRANCLARLLREKGVKRDTIVGMMMERSVEMIVGIMGILKAGGAYLPIDPSYPEERIKYTLSDSGTELLLTQTELLDRIDFNGTVIDLEDESVYNRDGSDLEHINEPCDLAYVIYTSGTTGKPKGAMIEHRNVVRLLYNDKFQFSFSENDVWSMFHSYCFDFSVWEMYGALLYGGTLVVVPKMVAKDTGEFLKLLKKERVTVLNQTPTAFYKLSEMEVASPDNDLCIRYVIFGGEALKPLMLKSWNRKYPDTKLINMYGITETTVHVTYKEIGEDEIKDNISNIGKPIPTLTCYVMDRNMRLLPLGVPGELCVGGAGLGRGYLNRPELTKERFPQNPYIPEERLYRSGDLVKMLPGGEMEYLGRIDHQVKIRGHRIELGEIEARLLKHEYVKEAVVLFKEDADNEKYLCAYFTSDLDLYVTDLRKHLAEELPEYMIPSYFIKVEKIPLTSNGKVDRKALPEPDGFINTGTEYQAPQNETEEKLIEVWKRVLGMDGIGTTHNFFDLGGHSLKATVLVSKIHEAMDVELSLSEVFRLPTIKEQAEFIDHAAKNIYTSIKPVEEQEYYPASAAQKRMYLINQFEGVGTAYNLPGIVLIEGKLDEERLSQALREISIRHEALRTSFEMLGGEVVQKIHKNVHLVLEHIEKNEGDNPENYIERFMRPFDLGRAPLARTGLVKLDDQRHLLMFDMHHIISDGVSMEIITGEIAPLYSKKALPELTIQYKDFSVWQQKLFQSGTIAKQEEYWLRTFENEIPALNMPLDYPRPAMQTFEGDSIHFEVEGELAEGLRNIASDTKSTLYMVLLAAFNVLLNKYTGQEDIIVGSPVAGRRHADLQGVIGMFVNTLAMRNYPVGDKNFIEFLKEVRGNALKAYENQDYQFEELLDKLNIHRDMSRNPLFDVMFTVQNSEMGGIEFEGIKLVPANFKYGIAKFDMTLTAVESKDKIKFVLEYASKLFKRESITRFAKHFTKLIEEFVRKPDIKISEIDILSDSEKKKLLFEYNETKAGYPEDMSIHGIFEEQARKIPGNKAVVFEDKVLTYSELNHRANCLARLLREKGVKRDTIVGMMMERSVEMIVGIMGILKAGGAYLPIDPSYPEERIKYTLSDSGTELLLTQTELLDRIDFNGTVIDLEDESVYNRDGSDLEHINEPCDLAYVIYTSGTTGKPKGAMIEHRNVVRLLYNDKFQFSFSENDVWSMFHSYCFDFSVWEMYGALLYGGTLVVVPKMVAKDTGEFLKLLKKERVTVLNQTPTAFYKLSEMEVASPDNDLCIRYVIFGGEALKPLMLKSWNRKYPDTKLINMYGITETTVHVTYKEIGEDEIKDNISNIGKPIPTLTCYVMDRNMRLLPIGVPGELCVGGAGLGRGYLNRPELTKERFPQNPYIPEERLYRSGDLVKMLPGGEMEYLGRIDHQVKIRGHRIELGEIEARLLKHESVKEAVVLVRDDANQEKYLCAYYVSDEELYVTDLRKHLGEILPEYMIPSYFIQVEAIPLNSNGKVDRKALPEPDGSIKIGTEYIAPQNDAEELLAQIWMKVLKVDRVGINDEFFDLGGDSLKAVQVVNDAVAQNIPIDLKQIFKYKTIAQIVQNMDCAEKQEEHKSEEVIRIEDRWTTPTPFTVDEDSVKELKMEMQREVTVYLHRALPLCIVLADPYLHPWFNEHYINIFSQIDKDGYLSLEYMELWGNYREVIGEVSQGAKMMEKVPDIIEFVREQISRGYYLNISVDEYYLPGKMRYQKIHVIHHELVYGFDDIRREIKAVGFDEGGVFRGMTFSYEDFVEAYEKGKAYYKESAPWTSTTGTQLFFSNGFTRPYPFRIEEFLKKLGDYLFSRSDEAIIYCWGIPEENLSYGFGVNEIMLKTLEGFLEGKFQTDYKSVHLLAEHKKLLAARFKYIIERYGIKGRFLELYDEYLNVVEQFNDVRLKFFGLQFDVSIDEIPEFGQEKVDEFLQMLEMLRKAIDSEKTVLMEMYENLKDTLMCD